MRREYATATANRSRRIARIQTHKAIENQRAHDARTAQRVQTILRGTGSHSEPEPATSLERARAKTRILQAEACL